MAIDLQNNTGRSLLWDSLAQNDVDMNHFRLLNLDTSNLPISAAPPTIVPGANLWLKAWDNPSRTWTAQQIGFANLSGNLSPGIGGQQRAITELGTIGVGAWQASVITGGFLTTLDLIRAPGGNVNLNGKRIINLGNPVNPGDAINLAYVDSLIAGIRPKQAVDLATTGSSPLVGLHPIDGVTPTVGQRVLVKDQDSSRLAQNGIYITSTSAWTRAPDCSGTNPSDPGHDINLAFCTVLGGTQNHGTKWVESAVVGIIGTDPVTFVLFTDASSGGAPGPQGPPGQGVPPGGLTHQILRKIDGTDFNTEWANNTSIGTAQPNYATLLTNRANPTGTTDTTGRMMGLSAVFTAITSGKVVANITGFMYNTSAAGAAGAALVVGSGSAPGNGQVQPVGTSAVLGGVAGMSALGASKAVPFSVTAIVTGVTPGIPFWFDLLLQAVTTGVATVGGVSVTAYEIP